jgi:tetratricopeptide (TPR) repeat protein
VNRRAVSITAAVVALVAIALISFLTLRGSLARRTPMRPYVESPVEAPTGPPLASLPLEDWSGRIVAFQDAAAWSKLDSELDGLRNSRRAEYDRYHLAYLHGRVKLESGAWDTGRQLLEPYGRPGSPFRDLALHHLADAAELGGQGEEGSRLRQELIFGESSSLYRDEAISTEIDWIDSRDDAAAALAFVERLTPAAPTALRRDLASHTVRVLARRGSTADAIAQGMLLLRGGTGDDPAERVFRALDDRAILERLDAGQIALLGMAAKNHRHFDRAIDLLSRARAGLPKRRDELTFEIGRSWFGNEEYENAKATYLAGARNTNDARFRATFLFHAARSAQLLGNDSEAVELMTRAIAVPGRFPATSAALTQRLRTRARGGDHAGALSDLAQLGRLFPRSSSVVEGTLAAAVPLIAAGDARGAKLLAGVPSRLLDGYDTEEYRYWRARAAEQASPAEALKLYLAVLASPVPTHYRHFATSRITTPALAQRAAEAAAGRRARAAELLETDADLAEAKSLQREAFLLSGSADDLARLREVYMRLPEYRRVLELAPEEFPALSHVEPESAPAAKESRARLLLALGLFDDARDHIAAMYPISSNAGALTQSVAFYRAGASRQSIGAIEVMMKRVPADFEPMLLPDVLRRQLYPRNYYGVIRENAAKHGADPNLVLAIMREESRFNPRAKSFAAARGLLQFIITTARDVGRSVGLVDLTAEDLYDPAIIIQLGAKYIGDLLSTFEGNAYRAAAAYNAGPNQTKLWNRIAPQPGDDYFLAAVNFDETKHYVRKVLNSYYQYVEIYGEEERK